MVRVHFSPPSDASQFFREKKLQKHRIQDESPVHIERVGGAGKAPNKPSNATLIWYVP